MRENRSAVDRGCEVRPVITSYSIHYTKLYDEDLVFDEYTTGAENDLQQATDLVERMVCRWGMSEKLGPISFVAPRDEGLPPAFQQQPYSDATSELIDAEVRRIVEEFV